MHLTNLSYKIGETDHINRALEGYVDAINQFILIVDPIYKSYIEDGYKSIIPYNCLGGIEYYQLGKHSFLLGDKFVKDIRSRLFDLNIRMICMMYSIVNMPIDTFLKALLFNLNGTYVSQENNTELRSMLSFVPVYSKISKCIKSNTESLDELEKRDKYEREKKLLDIRNDNKQKLLANATKLYDLLLEENDMQTIEIILNKISIMDKLADKK